MLRADNTLGHGLGESETGSQAGEDGGRTPEARDAKRGYRLLSLLNEPGRTPLPFDLHALAKSLGSELAAAAEAKGLESGLFIGTRCPRHVRGDQRRISMLMRSVIGDALRRTRNGSVKLHLDGAEIETGVMLRFDITTAPSDFDEAPQKPAPTRSGLELLFAKRLIEQMGGAFGFDNLPFEGTSVWFTVPAELAPRTSIAAESAPRLKGHILAVVHNVLSQRLLSTYLNEFGLTCDLVRSGKDALDRLSAAAYDLMLLDMATPELDAIKTALRVRKSDGPVGEIPILALIWHATKESREQYLAAGLDDYVAKPIRGRELHAALVRHLVIDEDAEPLLLTAECALEVVDEHAGQENDVGDQEQPEPVGGEERQRHDHAENHQDGDDNGDEKGLLARRA
jgi:CheY-like chemotaxis protein